MESIREVWDLNLEDEMENLNLVLQTYPVVCLDTEFPGFLRNTPRDAYEPLRYDDMKFNVDNLKLIQLGLTLSDADGRIGGTWQFNFRDFDPNIDKHVSSSIELLRRNGINLEKIKDEGVYTAEFADKFVETLSAHSGIQWVCFHGLYDLAYVMKVITRAAMPESATGFVDLAGDIFGRVYDVKFMARYCDGLLGGELGLERLAKILKVERCGEAHQAGSDSLLTAGVFSEMKRVYGLLEGTHEGLLYGLSLKIERERPPLIFERKPSGLLVFHHPQEYYQPAQRCHSYYSSFAWSVNDSMCFLVKNVELLEYCVN